MDKSETNVYATVDDMGYTDFFLTFAMGFRCMFVFPCCEICLYDISTDKT